MSSYTFRIVPNDETGLRHPRRIGHRKLSLFFTFALETTSILPAILMLQNGFLFFIQSSPPLLLIGFQIPFPRFRCKAGGGPVFLLDKRRNII